ncbi:MAG TPA: hypothetical protein VGQ83_32640 [Polyangia bacterium]|jgi:hypothetical protein
MPRSRFTAGLAAVLVAAALTACGPAPATFVKADQAALGRVVVYRNGIAYFERRARLLGDKLTLRVPADKVDDFLKSLTVADAASGQALPISFPSRNLANLSTTGMIDMVIPVTGTSTKDVLLTYVTEAPAWKPSYRVVINESGKVTLQGWAIVDNTSGEDWQAVRVGVGSSSALSFRFDLHSIRLVHRETLQTNDTFAKAPPRGGSVVRDERPSEEVVLGNLDDSSIPRQAGHPDQVAEAERRVRVSAKSSMGDMGGGYGGGGGGGRGPRAMGRKAAKAPAYPQAQAPTARPRYDAQREQPAPPPASGMDEGRLQALADSLKNRRGRIVIEGYANPGEQDASGRAADRANNLRNELILRGVAPAQVVAAGKGVAVGQRAGVRIVEQATAADKSKTPGAEDAAGSPVGETHFESKSAMTVARGQSAMVSIVHGPAQGEIVYLYDPESTSGSARFAFKAVRFRNPTTSALESGPVTVYGDGRFIGEGLTEAIPAQATAVVPFALDRQIVVDREGSSSDRIAQLVKVYRGILTAECQHLKLTKLKVTNRLRTPQTLLVRHTVARGWQITKAPKLSDQFGDARLFEIALGPNETKTIEIEEATPMVRTLDLRSPIGIDLVRVYLRTPRVDPAFQTAMDRLLKIHADMAQHEETIESLRQRGDEYRTRLDELHVQIMSLQVVKAKGTLLTHLGQKMKEISQRVQDNTIAIVDHQEKLMVAKVKFNEGLSELSLGKGATAVAGAVN